MDNDSSFGSASSPKQSVWEGLTKRTLVEGQGLKVDEFFFDTDVGTDPHIHTIEEAGYVVSGEFEVHLDAESMRLGPGDAWSVPAGVTHGVRCVAEGSYVVATLTSAE